MTKNNEIQQPKRTSPKVKLPSRPLFISPLYLPFDTTLNPIVLLEDLFRFFRTKKPRKVLADKDVAGGEGRRNIDLYLSEKLGGYKHQAEGGQLSAYGRNVEPILHGVEHTFRAIANNNGKEWARAKDEFSSVGLGLNNMKTSYQQEYTNNNINK
eukprot:gene6525-7555_t